MKTKKFKYIHYGKSYSCEVKKQKTKKNFYTMLLCSFSSYETAFFFFFKLF